MSQHRINTILSLAAVTLILAACSKNYSKDTPLPTTYNPSVIISSDNQILYAVDPATGKKNWQLSFSYLPNLSNGHYKPSPLLYNGSIYLVANNSDTLYKINSKTGAITQAITNSNNDSYSSIATPTADGNMIYLACLNGNIYALDTFGNLKWEYITGSSFESSPTVYKGQVYAATVGGHVYSLDKINGPDPISGLPTWDYPHDGTVPTGKFVSSVTVGDPYLYVGSISDSNMYCLYLTPHSDDLVDSSEYGQVRWTYKTNGLIYSSPAAYGGYCIFGSTDYYVYCLDTSIAPKDPVAPFFTPRVYWKFRTSSQILSSPLAYNQVIYIGSNDQNLYAINQINGSLKWMFQTSGLIKSSPAAYGSNIYIGSYDKNLYAVDSATGSVKWTVNTNGTIECSPVIDNFSAMFGFNSQISGIVD